MPTSTSQPAFAGLHVLEGSSRLPCKAQLSHVSVSALIVDRIAHCSHAQTFLSQSCVAGMAQYIFPLPEGASVTSFSATFSLDGRRVEGVVKKLQEARALFKEAVADSRHAALLEEGRPDVFQAMVGRVGPSEEVTVTLEYCQELTIEGEAVRFTIPAHVGERYFPGGRPADAEEGDAILQAVSSVSRVGRVGRVSGGDRAGGAGAGAGAEAEAEAEVEVDAGRRQHPNHSHSHSRSRSHRHSHSHSHRQGQGQGPARFSAEVRCRLREKGGVLLQSSSHPQAVAVSVASASASDVSHVGMPTPMAKPAAEPELEPALHEHVVAFEGEGLDRDFVLLVRPGDVFEPVVAWEEWEWDWECPARVARAPTTTTTATTHALMLSLVPKFELPMQRVEAVFLLDCSGSMQGPRMEQARRALQIFLRSLPSQCRFNVVTFGNAFAAMSRASMAYSDVALASASAYVDAIQANMGGTNVAPALSSIIQAPSLPGFERQIFVITDGQVANEREVISLARAGGQRIFALGVGSGVSTHLVQGLARASQGHAAFVQDGENGESLQRLPSICVSLLKKALTPAVSNLRITWPPATSTTNRPQTTSATRATSATSGPLPTSATSATSGPQTTNPTSATSPTSVTSASRATSAPSANAAEEGFEIVDVAAGAAVAVDVDAALDVADMADVGVAGRMSALSFFDPAQRDPRAYTHTCSHHEHFLQLQPRHAPQRPPAVHADTNFCAYALYPEGQQPLGGSVLLEGDTPFGPLHLQVALPARAEKGSAPVVHWMAARALIRDAEEGGKGEAAAAVGTAARVERGAEQLSLRFGLLCRTTAFVAVDSLGAECPLMVEDYLGSGWDYDWDEPLRGASEAVLSASARARARAQRAERVHRPEPQLRGCAAAAPPAAAAAAGALRGWRSAEKSLQSSQQFLQSSRSSQSLDRLLRLVSVDGSFAPSAALWALLGASEAAVDAWASTLALGSDAAVDDNWASAHALGKHSSPSPNASRSRSLSETRRVVATALALCCLTDTHGDEEDCWTLVGAKARDWLAAVRLQWACEGRDSVEDLLAVARAWTRAGAAS